MRMRLILLAIAAAAVLGAQPAGAPKRAAIRGVVTGAVGEPLRKAEVSLRGGGRGMGMQSVITQADGRFAFENLEPGSYSVSVSRTGYVRASKWQTVASGQGFDGLSFKLVPHGVIAGKVTDEDGDPVHRATVQLLRDRWVQGRRQTIPVETDSTNDLGEYRISGVAAGRYHLLVTSGRRNFSDGSGPPIESSYAPMYYPGVTEFAQAVPMTVAAGQEMRGADVQVRKVAVYRIRGRVIDEAGKPVTNAAVMAMQGEGSVAVRSMGMVRNAEGTFEIPGVTPGMYTLTVNRMSRDDRRARALMQVNVGNRDVEGLVVQIARSVAVSGRLRLPDDEQVPESARVTLEPLRNFAGENSESVKAEEGVFTFDAVAPGDYRFTMSGLPAGLYVKAVMAQGQDITAGATISAAAQDVEIVLGADAPEVSGTVLDSNKQPVASAWVVLAPESSQRSRYWLFRTAVADQSGAFSIRSVAPGRYTIFALAEDTEEGSWYDPEVLKTLESKGASVELEAAAAPTMLQVTLAR